MNNSRNVLVSILMPVYNVENLLERTLNSIFTQTYSNIEYVFVNDGSTDHSLIVLQTIIEKHQIDHNRYIIINHSENKGIAITRQDCISFAKGDYVFFVDSDDWIEPDAVSSMVDASNNGEVDIIGCDYSKDFIAGKVTYHRENYGKSCRENMIKCLNYDIATVLWKLLIRRKLFENIAITPGLNIGEDYIISVKLFYHAKSFSHLRRSVYHYVQYNQNRLSFQISNSINDHIRCVKEVESFLHEKGLYDSLVLHKLNLRKFNIKSNFLTKQLLDYKSYKTTFPEADGMWRFMGYSKKEKLKFWLVEHNLTILLKILLFFY